MSGPHGGVPVLRTGADLASARGAVILLHGRGASAEDILALGEALELEDVALLAPQAAGHTWYPYSFLAPRVENEPFLSSALETVAHTVQIARDSGLSADRIAIAGFSQGACLSSEFVTRHPQRYAGLVAFTGGLIGDTLDAVYPGDLAGTPVLLSSGDPDPHVPWKRVVQTAEVLRGLGAEVSTHHHPGRPHTVTRAEIQLASDLLRANLA